MTWLESLSISSHLQKLKNRHRHIIQTYFYICYDGQMPMSASVCVSHLFNFARGCLFRSWKGFHCLTLSDRSPQPINFPVCQMAVVSSQWHLLVFLLEYYTATFLPLVTMGGSCLKLNWCSLQSEFAIVHAFLCHLNRLQSQSNNRALYF